MGYGPIRLVHASGQVQAQYKEAEAATQTFKMGVPLRYSTGTLVQCDTNDPWGSADVVVGVSSEAAHNLAVAGTAEGGFSEGTPVNQPAAKIIPVGAWFRDGKLAYYRADGLNVFSASLATGQVFAQSMVGSTYTLKYDATTGYWYIDNTDQAGNNQVAVIKGVDPNDTTKVYFQFLATQRAF